MSVKDGLSFFTELIATDRMVQGLLAIVAVLMAIVAWISLSAFVVMLAVSPFIVLLGYYTSHLAYPNRRY